AGRKPALSAGTYATRRMRARRRFPMGNTWEHRPQGGKSFGWNGNVLTARLQIGGQSRQWPLKVINQDQADPLMAPLRFTRNQLQQAAAEELNCELGTVAAAAATAARAAARAQLANAISKAGGPTDLVEFVLKGPQEKVGTDTAQVTTRTQTWSDLRSETKH